MHNPLKFVRSVDNFVGKLDPPTTYRRTYIRRQTDAVRDAFNAQAFEIRAVRR
jgi:hypothetical protein